MATLTILGCREARVACFGPLDRSNQDDVRNVLRADTPTLVALDDVSSASNALTQTYFGGADRRTNDAVPGGFDDNSWRS
jgi:hypothetical protein